MHSKFLTLVAALLLLGACETPTEESSSSDAGGAVDQTSSSDSGSEVTNETIPGPTPGSHEDLVVNVGDRVFFDYDSNSLTDEGRDIVERLAAWLDSYGGVTITVAGHADERGTTEYNIALGDRRSNAVRDYLLALGISANRVDTISYGEERPAVSGDGEYAWSQNRRGVFSIN